MRAIAALVAMVLLVLGAGCAAGRDDPTPPAGADAALEATDDQAADPADGASGDAPAADPSLSVEDVYGRTPGDAFYDHMAAVSTGDPEAVWATYGCSPPAEFDIWAAEWEDAAEVYSGARVLEERVVGPGSALVRVAYRVTSGDDEIVIEEPGEWWRIEQVEGEWKVGWLPRQ